MAKNKKNTEAEAVNDIQLDDVQINENGEAAIVQEKPIKIRSRKLKYQDRYAIAGFCFALPFLIGFALFKLAPLVISLQLSFSKWLDPLVKNMQWIGWSNYYDLLVEGIENNRLQVACTSYISEVLMELPVINIAAFFFAILLNRKIPGQSTYRAIFFMPVLIGSGYAYDIMQPYMYEGMTLGIPYSLVTYLGGPEIVEYVVGFIEVFTSTLWKTGVQVLLYLTGLQGISKTLYESAYCDGATEWEQFWKITLPMMTPTILLCMIYTLIIKNSDASNPFATYYMYTAESGNGLGVYSGELLAAVSWVYALLSLAFIVVVFLIMSPIIKKNGGRD